MTIREYVKNYGFNIVGKLNRVNIPDDYRDCYSRGDRLYRDEAGNEFIVSSRGTVVVCASDGSVF